VAAIGDPFTMEHLLLRRNWHPPADIRADRPHGLAEAFTSRNGGPRARPSSEPYYNIRPGAAGSSAVAGRSAGAPADIALPVFVKQLLRELVTKFRAGALCSA
jgi:hypothetical protein